MAQEFYSYMDDREEPFSIEKPYLYQPKEDAIKVVHFYDLYNDAFI